MQEMGRRAVEMLLARIAGDDAENESAIIPVELVIRHSTAGDGATLGANHREPR